MVAAKLPLPGFARNQQGEILLSLEQILKGLRSRAAVDCDLVFDEFRAELMIAEEPGQWRPFEDGDAVELRIRLERWGWKERIGKEMMRDALSRLEQLQRFDSAVEWLTTVVPEWDGVSRVRGFMARYMGWEDSPYSRAVSDYLWSALAGRVLQPGVKADMVPVLVGPQGYRKSSGIAALVPDPTFFSEFGLDEKDDDSARKMRGCLVGELAELKGLNTAARESILRWIVRPTEEWTPKYKERKVQMARSLVFLASTNDDEFLNDPTGERRWLPGMCVRMVDVDAIVRDRLQLWAEARELFALEGVLFREAEALAPAEHQQFKVNDGMMRRVAAWLDDPVEIDDPRSAPRWSGNLLANDVLTDCLHIPQAKITKRDQMRVAQVLKDLGMVKVHRRVTTSANGGGHRPSWRGVADAKVWVDASEEGQ